jgi:hypothetical protein
MRRKALGRTLAMLAVLGGSVLAGLAVAAPPAEPQPDKITPAADPLFNQPYIDKDEWRDTPVRHRYVHGGFKGTDTRFSFYFPDKAQYRGHFFQYITPVPDSETLSQGAKGEEDKIGFSIASGAYFIETNGGGSSATAGPAFHADPTIAAYRANAAAAQYSRVLAMEMYGPKRPYGYAFGGSGGAYRTIGGIENTKGVWDGAVPFVMGSPMAAPNVFAVRMHAMRLLWDKFPEIVDALEPGGSGDPYAGLNVEQRQALAEVTRMGFPPLSWFGYKTMGVHAFSAIYQGMVMADPGYFKDFWTKPGYLGFDAPQSLTKARLQFPTTVKAVITPESAARMGVDVKRIPGQGRGTADLAWQAVGGAGTQRPIAFQLGSTPPNVDFLGGDLIIKSGAAAGKTVDLREITGDKVMLGVTDAKTLALVKPGDQVEIDNSNFLAAQTYHRHQVPGPEFHVWDQFRDSYGKPIYPQRPVQLGPMFTMGAAGTVPTGKFEGKVIVLESLWDREAFPWQADWYRARVTENLGNRTDDNYRLWYTDHALHADSAKQEDGGHTISYLGALQQALRDLSDWVEKGIVPPQTTGYRVVDGQVIVPASAGERKGIQPVVALTVNGAKRADVGVGKPVTLTASVQVPPGTGRVVAADWDLDGSGDFATPGQLVMSKDGSATVTLTQGYAKPGTYFPVLRAASQRQGDGATPFARIYNLDRVRVVVQ